MATIAYDDSDTGFPERAPISAHPAFPAIVALWFAALLGLGSMVLPAVLLDRALLATGLASLVPALSPPLDLPARGIVAMAAALAGAMIGVAVARRVARAQEPQPAPRFEKFVASMLRRPISVHEELGGEGVVNGHGMPVTRRRALAITEDDRPSDFLYTAPLPGDAPYDPPAPPPEQAAAHEDPLELSDAMVEGQAPSVVSETAASHEDHTMSDRQEFRPIDTFAAEGEPAAEPDIRAALEAPDGEPLPFAAPSLSRRLDHHFGVDAEPANGPRATADPTDPEPLAGETQRSPAAEPADWSSAPPESLGLVQLVQRLGHSIERRREWLAETAAAPVALHGVAEVFEPAPAEEAVQAMAAYFGRADTPEAEDAASRSTVHEAPLRDHAPLGAPQTVAPVSRATFLRSFAGEADNEDDTAEDLPDFSLPLGRPEVTAAATATAEDQEKSEFGEVGEADDLAFGSLLAMSNPFAGNPEEFVRIDEPDGDGVEPAVVFPQTAPALQADPHRTDDAEVPPQRQFDAPGEGARTASVAQQPAAGTDAALRSALATLQRMNGAA